MTIDRLLIAYLWKHRKQILRELAAAVGELRQDAKDKGFDGMSKAEMQGAWPSDWC